MDIRAGGVDSGMDHERGLVQEGVRARLGSLDGAMMVDEDEVFGLDQGEVLPLQVRVRSTLERIKRINGTNERVDPEAVGSDRVLYEGRDWS